MEFEKPKTSNLVLKPKEIVPTDAPSRPGDGNAISVQLIHQQNAAAESKALHDAKKGRRKPLQLPDAVPPPSPVFKPTEFEVVNERSKEQEAEAIRVADILLQNRMAEEEAGLGKVKRRRRGASRRRRDFLIVVGATAAIVAATLRFVPGPFALVFGLSALALVTVSVGWVLFFVMDKY
jgi:hypothetical protein